MATLMQILDPQEIQNINASPAYQILDKQIGSINISALIDIAPCICIDTIFSDGDNLATASLKQIWKRAKEKDIKIF